MTCVSVAFACMLVARNSTSNPASEPSGRLARWRIGVIVSGRRSASPAAWEVRDVPHGSVVTEWQKSTVLNRTERIVVYLPPGYQKSAARFPILYLVHGSGDTPEFQRQTRDFLGALRNAQKPAELVFAEGYNHFELIETIANPYGVAGHARLQQMGLV